MSVSGVQITIYGLEYGFVTSFVSVPKRAASYLEGNAEVHQLACLCKQGGGYLA